MGQLIMIAAAGDKNELGKDNSLLWHLPDDFKRFKKITRGHKIIMGRKTFESFPKPLVDRKHIVISRNPVYTIDHPDCVVVTSLEEALRFVHEEETAFIIGGGQVYKQALPYCDVIELTRVHAQFEADTFFPELPSTEWQLITEEYHSFDEKHAFPFTYRTYKRIRA
ncbi:MAG: dihydrofolate reductase [Eudoraea sp.]|nr:dihydrofolate reductase [Eudoraea sp.]